MQLIKKLQRVKADASRNRILFDTDRCSTHYSKTVVNGKLTGEMKICLCDWNRQELVVTVDDLPLLTELTKKLTEINN